MFLEIQASRAFYKIKDWTKLTIEMWSQIVEKGAVFGLRFLLKN